MIATLRGNDVSKWNIGAQPSGDFLLAKATQGVKEVDPDYTYWRDYAQARGQLFGAYWWANGTNAITEADNFLSHAGHQPGEVMMLDAESKGLFAVPDPVGWCLDGLRHVNARTGVKPLIYLNLSTVQRLNWSRVVQAGFELWLAYYNQLAPVDVPWWVTYRAWQYGGTGIDSDIFYGSATDWRALGGETPPPPEVDMQTSDLISLPGGAGQVSVGSSMGQDQVSLQTVSQNTTNLLAAQQTTNDLLTQVVKLLQAKA